MMGIEVKATGDQGLNRLSAKDLKGDYLVFVHLSGKFFGGTDGSFVVRTLKQPGKYFAKSGYLYVNRLEPAVDAAMVTSSFTFDDLVRGDQPRRKRVACFMCGALVPAKGAAERFPMCPSCEAARAHTKLMLDIQEGRLIVPRLHNEDGEPVEPPLP